MMPNKTIYVADADIPIFDRAQELAGDNLSSTIVQALRRYVEAHENRQAGFQVITLRVGSSGAYTMKRFTGRLLARGQYRNADRRWRDVFEVFKSFKGKIVVYRGNVPSWWGGWNWNQQWQQGMHHGPMGHFGMGPVAPGFGRDERRREKLQRRWEERQEKWKGAPPNMPWENAWMDKGDFRLDIYDTLEEIKSEVPEDLYERVKNQLNGDEIETLDI
jgi:hypothetical protein